MLLHVPCDRSPSQYIKLSLIWPVIRVRNVPMTNGIAANIFPFVTVGFAGPQLSIPVMTLPQRAARLPMLRVTRDFQKRIQRSSDGVSRPFRAQKR
jgi:hypothetical protein